MGERAKKSDSSAVVRWRELLLAVGCQELSVQVRVPL